MSSLYNLEPQPTASCLLHTTSGDISLELFAQQCPLTCRNFLQHCLDGYYDGTIFHRLIPGFILQGGDPTNTGAGGESIFDGGAFGAPRDTFPPAGHWPAEERKGKNAGPQGVGFKDEFHSRLKFNRRGQVAMANEGTPDTNGSQFFFTLGECKELQGKNTLFGRVEGNTIYNLQKMGEAECEEGSERPLYPTRITSTEVLVNPFKDMVRRERTAAPVQKEKPVEKKKKRKAGKQLLSFGDEEGEETTVPVKKTKFDTRIVMDVEPEALPVRNADSTSKPKSKSTEKKAEKLVRKPISRSPSPASAPAPKSKPSTSKPKSSPRRSSVSPSPSPEPQVQKVSSLLDETNAQIAQLKASMRRNVQTAPVPEKKKSALEAMIPSTSIRGRKRGAAANGSASSDAQALAMLNAFKAKLDSAPAEKADPAPSAPEPEEPGEEVEPEAKRKDDTGDDEAALCDLHFIADCQSCKKWDTTATNDLEDDDDKGDKSWMSHALSFKADKLGKDLSYRKKAEEELVVIDPREKARTLKEEKKAQREARSGGNTGREWDAKRNEKMARQSALAGRGAK